MLPDRVLLDPFVDFTMASRFALEFLRKQLGMGLWLVTRVSGAEQIVLAAASREDQYPIGEGDVFRFSDSFCSRMVTGEGPQFAPRAAEVAAYREAPAAKAMTIGAYMGVPLCTAEGELFGTLCAIDPSPQPETRMAVDPLLQIIGRLLATVLDRDLRLTAESRRVEKAEAAAMLDELTGLWNHRAWDRFRAAEESRCRRYGHCACVLSLDLDGLKVANDTRGHAAGDDLLRCAARALKHGLREQDIVARVGGDEFGVLLVECQADQGKAVERRLREHLENEQVAASIGFARRDPATGLDQAWSRADEAMVRDKRDRQSRRRR